MTTTANDAYATRLAPGTVRLERLLPGPAERLWPWLVDARKRRLWFAGGEMEHRVGGTARLHFLHRNFADEPTPPRYAAMDEGGITFEVRVTAWDPPRLLAFTWPEGGHESEVRFELFPEAADTRLVLTHVRLAGSDQMADVSSGWHAHLAVLEAALAGRKAKGFWSNVMRLESEYGRRFGAG